DHHGFRQTRLADLAEEAFLGQRAFEMVIRTTGADAPVQPARGVVLGGARCTAEEGVQKGRTATQVDHFHDALTSRSLARTSKAPPVRVSLMVTACLPISGKTSSAKR